MKVRCFTCEARENLGIPEDIDCKHNNSGEI